MFIKLGDYIIPIDNICFIKIIGSGVNVYIKSQMDPIKIATVPEIELQMALDKLFLRRNDLYNYCRNDVTCRKVEK